MRFLQKYNNSIWLKLLLYIPMYFLLLALTIQYYNVCELGGSIMKSHSLKTFIDAWTPVNIYIMWPYLLCLTYVPFSGLLYAFNRKINSVEVLSFYLSVILIYIVTYAIYIVFPTTASEVMLTQYKSNEHLFINKGMFEHLQDLYNQSTPFGDFPSLHVSPLVFMGMFLFKKWRVLFWIFLPFAFLGAIGTFVLKFHTFAGFSGGAVVGYFGYTIFYEKLIFRHLNRLVTLNGQ